MTPTSDMEAVIAWLSHPGTPSRLRELVAAGVRSIALPGGAVLALEAPPPPAQAPRPPPTLEELEIAAVADVTGSRVPFFEQGLGLK